MKMYEQYKETGYKHIPIIPEHWKVKKHRSFLIEKKDVNSNDEGTLLSLSQYTGVSVKTNTDKQGMFRAESLVGYRIVHPQDIVMNIMLAWNGSTACSKFEGVISPAYAVFKVADNKIAPNYLHYLYRIPEMCGYFKAYSTGIIDSRLRLYPEIFMQLYSVIPSRDEQDQIVRYLDWQVSKINHLIHGYQKQIKLLEERKFTILDQLVHNGILASEFNEYDIEYIGKVPAHWHVLQNHRIFESVKRKFEGMPTVLSLSQKDGLIPYSELNERTLHTASYDNWQLVHENDLVLNRFKAHLGVFFASKYTGIVTFHYGVYKPKMPLLSKYYETLYHTQVYKRVYAGQSKGMTIGLQNLSDTDFYSVYTLYPPYDEQVAIVREIESVEEKFLKIRAGIIKQIELLKEYRTRLISDVVTGQIDVRDVVIPEYTPEEDTEIDTDDDGEDMEEVAEDAE